MSQFIRTEMLLGTPAMGLLQQASVAIFGIGGVGSYTVEALARGGITRFSLFDNDTVCLSNINRQLVATHSTIGMAKVEVAKRRILDINPLATVDVFPCFYEQSNADTIDLAAFDYVVDAIDTISSKLLLIERATQANVPIISCMGAGNKLDPTQFEVADIYDTSVCPLAKVMRKALKTRGIHHLQVVYSKEPALTPLPDLTEASNKRQTPGSVSFVPSVAGLILAGVVIKNLIQ